MGKRALGTGKQGPTSVSKRNTKKAALVSESDHSSDEADDDPSLAKDHGRSHQATKKRMEQFPEGPKDVEGIPM